MEYIAIFLLIFLSFANGSNDLSKSVATLAGCGLTTMRNAIYWGSFWMALGGISGIYWGTEILKNLTEHMYATTTILSFELAFAIAITPILWVSFATWKKWPVSTTHAVIGGMVGAGIAAFGLNGLMWVHISLKIILPLLISPLVALILAIIFFPSLKKIISYISQYQVCLKSPLKLSFIKNASTMAAVNEDCVICKKDDARFSQVSSFGLSENHMHWLTSALLSFARGLNDTPKLIAVCLPIIIIAGIKTDTMLFIISATFMGFGGLLFGKRVMRILGFKITKMDHQQGFAANLLAAILVIGASRFGMPVSTTHVSSTAIIGVGIAGRKSLQLGTIKSIIFAWIITVPVAAICSAAIYIALSYY